jgi:DNA-binding NtrC family response regulator
MSKQQSILLVTHRPFVMHDSVLESKGFDVVTVHSLEVAQAIWQPGKFRLMLVEPNGNLTEALAFCHASKKTDPHMRFAFMTRQGTYPPIDSCPDDVIMLQYNPEQFVQRVSELVS